ncbi:gamma-aminobutyric acid type B receptor subunit 2-like [Diadema antillarum]|uniref:gamma-aminobutyric acid type B receptor subunit 2-like n=1 Tax=Diadema antillarum TaxID=105358 RepID=UPI003A8468F8
MATGLKAFFESMARPPRKFMVFGGACPSVTSPIATSVHWWNLVQLSYADTTPSLSQRDKYPHFFRTVPSETDIGAARVRLFQLFNWTSIATIHQDTPRYSYAQSKQVKMADDNGVHTVVEATFADDPQAAVKQVKSAGARIVMGFFDEEMARRVFCEVYKQEMYGARHVWLIPGWYKAKWWRKADNNTKCSVEELEEAVKGYIATDILQLSASEETTISGLTPLEYKALYDAKRAGNYSDYHGYAYDGVWVMALAIDHVIKMFEKENNTQAFFDFEYDDREMLAHFSKAMNETNFPGVTGVVQFREGERLGCTMHKQLQEGEMVKVAEYYAITDSLNLSTGAEFQWKDGGPPADVQMKETLLLRVSLVVFVVLATLATAGIIMAVGFLIFNMRSRNQRYIKMSSPFLNNLIILGGILTYGSIFVLGLDHGMVGNDDSFKIVCTARGWFLCIGFTLAFGAMFSKTWRVHRIFTNIKMKKKVIKDHQLYAIVGVMLVIDLIILITWQVFDPVKPMEVELEEREDPTGRDVLLIPVIFNCKSKQTMIWLAIIYIYKGVLMIFGLFLAWETRHVSIPALNDSKYIGMSVYNVVIMCVLGVSLSFMISDNPNASYGLVSTFILFCTTITLCLVFVPKVIELRFNPNANERIRVVGTLDKTRTCSTNIGTMDSESKLRGLAIEKNELSKKLSDQSKKVKELEAEYMKIAPEDAPLLLGDDWSSGIDNSISTARSRGDSTKTATSPVSVTFNVHSSKINHTKESKGPSNMATGLHASHRWAEEADEADEETSVDLYANFGGVYIGPPEKEEDPLTSDLISAGNTNFMDTPCTDGIAEVHRSFEDTIPLTGLTLSCATPSNIPIVAHSLCEINLQYRPTLQSINDKIAPSCDKTAPCGVSNGGQNTANMAPPTAKRELAGKWWILVVAANFAVETLQQGFLKSMGVLLPSLVDYFDTDYATMGTIVSVEFCTSYIGSECFRQHLGAEDL